MPLFRERSQPDGARLQTPFIDILAVAVSRKGFIKTVGVLIGTAVFSQLADRRRAAAAGFLVDCAKVTDSKGELIYSPAFNARPGEYKASIGSDPPTLVGFNEGGVFVVEKLYGLPSVVLYDPNFERKVGKPPSWLAMVQQSFTGNAAGGETLWATGDPSLRTAICK